ncbi:hypothetical protein SPRG_15687 [Saprolegnia parasitica CBS 223.65]|uniref:Elicitin n=1 Tax=Saprolegnia parasitica (strain CBS 223.65) TaxID=695850 RepID=A0A067BL34_SAPPC|nr:hypothetical protein SPRG_15687 [Saprolegnia parasitica CBS 223.65]KDO19164.1 hypothetical protein SPRG_15687 [Saprolegnia parasitica CBS 223.65]|eukprot:XP_012210134.1 hypothetical protein SPRG_15687 [Saprolegnia parasitica CBS 223.65]
MQLILATALSIISFASAAPCTSAEFNSIDDTYATTLTAACASSLKMNTSATISTAMGYPYGFCQPECATDLNSLSSGIAICDGTAPAVAIVAQFRQMCTDLANPTMNGGKCTTSDMILHSSIMESPVWTN